MIATASLAARAIGVVARMTDDAVHAGVEPAVTEPGASNTDRLVTIPNLISVVRLCCIPLFLWLLFGRDSRVSAAVLLAVLGATDWVDGYIARHFDQVSEIGKILDPTADRLMFIVGVGAMIIDRSVPLWFAIVVVSREVLVGGALALLTAFGMKRFDVSWYGKAATFGLMFAFTMFLLAAGLHGTARTIWLLLAWACGLPALGYSLYSAWLYVPTARKAFAEGRRERAT